MQRPASHLKAKLVVVQDCKCILGRVQLAISVLTGVYLLLSASEPSLRAAQAPRRINREINDSQTFRVVGNTRPMLSLAEDQGEISSPQALPRISIHFTMSSQQHEGLEALLRQQQTRGAAQFHKFLTPEEYADRFGLNTEDLARITQWLQQQGFTNVEVARSRTYVSFAGTAGLVQTAFGTSISPVLAQWRNSLREHNRPVHAASVAGGRPERTWRAQFPDAATWRAQGSAALYFQHLRQSLHRARRFRDYL